ncbi:DUF4276 family protein [Vitiosangium sp. GDMCC 1.1324]|uniref:DUF4276 family protein n=1 Tax=Vitiosangium sp. (strain GDMCC 1.1324) TaxID=2138576 RepID=UPI000D3A9F9E|nr:DUF4276 family protein [Vitiosangium sp. GDMCC 1.1324]PTL77693.1 hypothetical protein DAT35_43690 [Vitiosangium sp. GDMCC 1.1324]
MKFVLFVEGHTERKALPEFLKRWLDARLPQKVGIKIVRFEGWRDYDGESAKKVELNLGGKVGADVIAGIGLLDLYGPTFYPADKTTAAARYEWAKAHLEKKVGHERFRQHFAVHETEAWLLADPTILPGAVSKALPGKSHQPETVNFNEPPAKLLERLYKEKLGRSYKKLIDGANLFAELSPDVAQAKCPYLRRLLQDMLVLAQAAMA